MLCLLCQSKIAGEKHNELKEEKTIKWKENYDSFISSFMCLDIVWFDVVQFSPVFLIKLKEKNVFPTKAWETLI